jgi:hypothetical protein
MDKKVIQVTIKDGGNDKTFSIRLFGALEGMDFLDRLMAQGNSFSIKAIAGDLLPLASLVAPDGKVIDTMSLSKVDTYFENPLSVIELAHAIFKHQMVFMNESETFRKLIPTVENMFNMPSSDSVTK